MSGLWDTVAYPGFRANGITIGINNALLTLELPKLVERLREAFKDDAEKPLTRRTGWKLLWDVRRSKVTITQPDGTSWEQKVGEMPPSVQEIVAKGGVVKWVQSKIRAGDI